MKKIVLSLAYSIQKAVFSSHHCIMRVSVMSVCNLDYFLGQTCDYTKLCVHCQVHIDLFKVCSGDIEKVAQEERHSLYFVKQLRIMITLTYERMYIRPEIYVETDTDLSYIPY